MIYFIDECQAYFDRKFYDKEVFFYFQTHRHLGHDIYLITQDIRLMPVQIIALVEYEICAQARSVAIFNELKYIIKSGGESIDRKICKKDQSIFDLYKSMDTEETESLKNPFVKYIFALIVFFVVACYVFYTYFLMPSSAKANKKEEKKEVQQISEPVKKVTLKKDGNIKNSLIENMSESTTLMKMNYALVGSQILIVDPITSSMVPVNLLPYPVTVQKLGRSLLIFAKIPNKLLPKTDTNTQGGKSLDRDFQAESMGGGEQ